MKFKMLFSDVWVKVLRNVANAWEMERFHVLLVQVLETNVKIAMKKELLRT